MVRTVLIGGNIFMEQYKVKSLKKFKASGLCSFICALNVLLFAISIIVFAIQCLIKSQSYKFTGCIVGVLLVTLFIVTTLFNTFFEWYIDARLEKKQGKWYVSYFEALGFLGIDRRTEVEILELTGYDIKKKSISFYGKFRTHEQMKKSDELKSLTITGRFEDEEKAIEVLNKLTGYVQPSKEEIKDEVEKELVKNNDVKEPEMSAEEIEQLLKEYREEKEQEKELENRDIVVDTNNIVGSILGNK